MFAVFQVTAGFIIYSFNNTSSGAFIINEGIRDIIFSFSKLKTGYFTWNDYKVHKSKGLAKLFVQFVHAISSSNKKWLRTISKPIKQMVDYFEKQKSLRTRIRSDEKMLIKNSKKIITNSEVSLSANSLIDEQMSKLTNMIIDNVSKNISDLFMEHDIKETINKALSQSQQSTLTALIQEEFLKTKFFFDEINKIHEYVAKYIEQMMKKLPDDTIPISIEMIAEAASVKSSLIKIFDNFNTMIKDFLANEPENHSIEVPKNEATKSVHDYFIYKLKKIATEQFKTTLESTIITPGKINAEKGIENESSRNILDLFTQLTSDKSNNQYNQDAMKIYEEMNASTNLSMFGISEDLLKQSMHIHSRATNYKQYENIILESIPYDEVCIESFRQLIEYKLNKKPVVIRITKNENIFEFGCMDQKEKILIELQYSKMNLYTALSIQLPELEFISCPKNLSNELKLKFQTDSNIITAIKSYNNGFYKNFKLINSHIYIGGHDIGYGFYDDLKKELTNEQAKEIIVVHFPLENCHENWTKNVNINHNFNISIH